MFDSIIKDLHNGFVGIKILLNTNKTKDAEKALANAAKNLKELMGYADYSLFIVNYEKQLSEFIDVFIETSMAVSFASTYNLIDAYNNAVAADKTTQAEDLLQQVEHKIAFMKQAYANAVERGQSRTSAFIDFEKDLSYLLKYLEDSKRKDLIQQMCNNFDKAMNFTETQQQFFYHRRTPNTQLNTNTLDEQMHL
ncbi:hypothetical protein [Legionella maioricensis]|uniref:Uncharacterized protein n=1 Tax=Legionella maioricensis TaxID=2896528 RepID=A0A9X2D2E9_9GAMM|nr:hypothetical protein [Legionella maioricensis]MCL9685314.1 hypothetical protein [Legionella maioricensis]MCL9688569.1 hypothetical protein [Legionella maioricensis]